MINCSQFEGLVTTTLNEMNAFSQEALLAIMMIVSHESHCGTYLRQIKGPALGVIQMEPATHESLWRHADNIKYNAARCGIVKNVKALEYDLKYNIFMARSMLLTDPRPLPSDEVEMSRYLKKFYNSSSGKAKDDSYVNAYRSWKNK